MAVLFEKTKLLSDKQFHYCPGCNHGIIPVSYTHLDVYKRQMWRPWAMSCRKR